MNCATCIFCSHVNAALEFKFSRMARVIQRIILEFGYPFEFVYSTALKKDARNCDCNANSGEVEKEKE